MCRRLALALAALLGVGCSFDHGGLGSQDVTQPDLPAAVDARHDAVVDLASADGPGGDAASDADAGPDLQLLDQSTADLGPPLTPLAQDDGRLWLGLSSGGPVELWRLDGSSGSWSVEVSQPPVTGDVTYIRALLLPTAEELGLVKSVSGNDALLALHRYAPSTGWTVPFSHTVSGTSYEDKLDYDLVREASSGDLLLVHGDESATPRYATASGGSWSASSPVPGIPTAGKVLWTRLVPRPGSDEVTLLYADDNDDLAAITWTGSAWDTAGAKVLETSLKVNPNSGIVGNRTFDGAYESKTGKLLVAWGVNGESKFYYATRDPGSGWSGKSGYSVVSGLIEYVQLAADPSSGSQKIAGVFADLGNGTERLGLGVWEGGSWIGAKEYDSTFRDVNDKAEGDQPAAVAWVGTTGQAVCVYSDNATGQVDWYKWTSGDWSAGSDQAIPGKAYTESVTLRSFNSRNEVLAVISDSKSQVYAATYDGSSWSVAPGMPFTSKLAHLDSVPFSLAVKP